MSFPSNPQHSSSPREHRKLLTAPSSHCLSEIVIDLNAIHHNVSKIVEHVAPAQVIAVVKADAYNHGACSVARTALDAGATHLGVATLEEALSLHGELAEQGIHAPIMAWMWYPEEELSEVLRTGIILGIPSLDHARALSAAIRSELGTSSEFLPVPISLMVDTGLSRSGVGVHEWKETVAELVSMQQRGEVYVEGLSTHLASADDPQSEVTAIQNRRFEEALDYIRSQGLDSPRNHVANTPATLLYPHLHYEMVRPGVAIYGVDPVDYASLPSDFSSPILPLQAAMTWRAKVISTRIVPDGEGVSYGHHWVAKEDTYTAVIAVGYADGLLRSLSGRFSVGIGGQLYPQIGRICMDQIVVSLGAVAEYSTPPVTVGDWAVIFGQGGMSLHEIAETAGTIDYEILTLPRQRVSRRTIPVGGGERVAATPDELHTIAEEIAQQLQAGDVLTLTGPLGAGKTTFVQGLARALKVRGRVQSPTFTVVRTHQPELEGEPGLLHMDAYRLLGEKVQEGYAPAEAMDRDEVLDMLESLDIDADLDRSILVAEWGRGVVESLSNRVLDVEIQRQTYDSYSHYSSSMRTGLLGGNVAQDGVVDGVDEARIIRWQWVKR